MRLGPEAKRQKRRVLRTSAFLFVASTFLVVATISATWRQSGGSTRAEGYVRVSPTGDIEVSFAQANKSEHRVVVDARFRSAGNDTNWWEEWWLEIGTAPNTDLVANLIEHRREDLLVAIREGLPGLQHVLTIWNDALPEGSPRGTRYFPVNWLRENIIYLAAWILINAAAITSMWLLRYRIPARRSLEGRCFACGYQIGVSGQTTCPECGKDVSNWMRPNPAEQSS